MESREHLVRLLGLLSQMALYLSEMVSLSQQIELVAIYIIEAVVSELLFDILFGNHAFLGNSSVVSRHGVVRELIDTKEA